MSFNMPSAQTANVFTGIAGLVTGIGQMMGGKAESNLGEYNAAIYDQRATAERQSQNLYEYQKRKIVKSQIGTQINQAGASGFRFTGNPIKIMQESMANAEMDIAIDKYNSEVTARGFQSAADMERYEAKARASRGYTVAASSFLSTAADLYMSETLGGSTIYGKGTSSGKISPISRIRPLR